MTLPYRHHRLINKNPQTRDRLPLSEILKILACEVPGTPNIVSALSGPPELAVRLLLKTPRPGAMEQSRGAHVEAEPLLPSFRGDGGSAEATWRQTQPTLATREAQGRHQQLAWTDMPLVW